jgi:anthranilate 1,2-dioxygenase (deaminating, decarboxylating) small subunit
VDDPRLGGVAAFLFREAELVDTRRWDVWLELFAESAEYWVPAWDSEHEHTTDPNSQVSLIYYSSRAGLEDRVFRLRTGMSSASTPFPRTSHHVTNIRAAFGEDGRAEVKANWHALSFRLGETTGFFGTYDYLLEPHAQSWRILKKKILVLNAVIPTVLDIYLV